MRGSLGQSGKVVTIIGIPPACAGTTRSVVRVSGRCAIQPRVCGDYHVAVIETIIAADTTPRVRGLLAGLGIVYEYRRYNPACAGTTWIPRPIPYTAEIQPRVCGDYAEPLSPPPRGTDTTPRVRGLRNLLADFVELLRYNPACAGTTSAPFQYKAFLTIQPRVCGDYSFKTSVNAQYHDTTPRVRGLRYKQYHLAICARYNPACAGTT